jgi:hypothetical protein
MTETHVQGKWGKTFAILKRGNANTRYGGIVMMAMNVLLTFVMGLGVAVIRVILDFAMTVTPAHWKISVMTPCVYLGCLICVMKPVLESP